MKIHPHLTALALLLGSAAAGTAAEAVVLPPGQKEPFLRLQTGGPSSLVTSLAFSPDGETLYAAGWDKEVRVWRLDRKTGLFQADSMTYRVPVGAGLDGAINSMALSPDGNWLAVGGRMIARGESGYRDVGIIMPAVTGYTPEMHQDRGVIFVFNTKTQEVRVLRKGRGQVVSLAFAPTAEGKPPLLTAFAQEWDDEAKKYHGAIRLWNVDKSEEVAELLGLPDTVNRRPGLAVWHTGKGPRQVRVGFALSDGSFRVWSADKASEAAVWKADGEEEGDFTAAYLPEPARVLTGSFRRSKGNGHLQAWFTDKLGADEKRFVDFAPELSADKKHTQDAAVWGVTTLSSKPGGAVDTAAVLLRRAGIPTRVQLRFVSVAGDVFTALDGNIDLWKGSARLPVIAAVPGGRYLAVAGRDDSAILVFPIAGALAGKGEPQVLRGDVAALPTVAFAANGKNLGVLLSPHAKQPGKAVAGSDEGDLLFDLAGRRLTTRTTGWKPAGPDAAGWKVTPETDKNGKITALVVARGDAEGKRIALSAKQFVADYALLPPQAHIPFPVLAVAFSDDGRPRLYLYNAESGDAIRWFTGHSDFIRSVAFSPDGRLLASAGDDHIVCVWNLTNKDRILGQRGMLLGVGVEERKGAVSVVEVDADSKAQGKLARGDVIEGLRDGDKLIPFATNLDYIQALALRKPGDKLTLSVRTGDKARDVALTLGTAQDERKPLFYFFTTRPDARDQRHWIGWTPLGPYDSSGPVAERYLGWHFNTGDPESPTRFARADQYHDVYYKEGILADLTARGNLTDALKDWDAREAAKRLPVPALSLALEENGQEVKPDAQGTPVLRQPKAKVTLTVDGFPVDRIASLTWQLDGAAAQEFAGAGLTRSADLENLKRGNHRVRVVLRTQEANPKDYTRELTFRYQAPAPTILSTLPARKQVKEAELTYEAEVKPGIEGDALLVTLSHRHEGKEQLTPEQQKQGLKIKQKLTLLPGDNEIRVIAVAKDALKGQEEAETAQLTTVVSYFKTAAPPLVVLSEIQPLPDGTPIKVVAGQVVVVDAPKVRLTGKITADADLAQAVIARGSDAPQALAKFAVGKHKEWTISEEVELAPGPQTVRVSARTAESKDSEAIVTLVHRSALPRVEITDPLLSKTLYEGEDRPQIEVKARLIQPAGPRKFRAALLVNGEEQPGAQDLTEKAKELTFTATFKPGDNGLRVRLTNEWKAVAVSDEVVVQYLQAPRNIRFEDARPGAKPFIDLVALVDSPLPLRADSVRATVNREPFAGAEVVEPARAGAPWQVRLKNVPLAEGANTVTLSVGNADAAARTPGSVEIMFKPPVKPKPPVAEILSPSAEKPVPPHTPVIPVTIRVKSATALQSVDLVRDAPGKKELRQPVDLSKLPKEGEVVLNAKVELPLVAGLNTLRLEATNEGGKTFSDSVLVSFTLLPVRVFIDRLEVKGAEGKSLFPKALSEGRYSFDEAAQGRVRLYGKVVWGEAADERFKATHLAQVFVNGFQQAPATLRPADKGRQREFVADVVLNRKQNEIEVALPGIVQDANSRTMFSVACREPVPVQRLHLLLVSVTERDDQKVREQALIAFHAEPTAPGQYRSPCFDQIFLYGPLTESQVTPGKVYEQFQKIDLAINRQPAGSGSDVVMIYYQGGETIDAGKWFFTTSVSQRDPDPRRSAINTEALARRLSDSRGMPLVLLDVNAATPNLEEAERLSRWTEGARFGLLRYAWLGSSERPTDTPRLLADVADGTSRNQTLGQVAMQTGSKFSPRSSLSEMWTSFSSPRYPAFVYERYLPDGPAAVEVGRK